MSKISLNKTELKKQQEKLDTYRKCLPLLELKKKQLQSTERSLQKDFIKKSAELRKKLERLESTSSLISQIEIDNFLGIPEVKSETVNNCGVKTKKLLKFNIPVKPYNLKDTPFWLESLLDYVIDYLEHNFEHSFLKEELTLITSELTKVSQRVNLYSKIPYHAER